MGNETELQGFDRRDAVRVLLEMGMCTPGYLLKRGIITEEEMPVPFTKNTAAIVVEEVNRSYPRRYMGEAVIR